MESSKIEKLENLASWMDSRFRIPGTNIRFGFDSLLGLIPGIGDTVTVASTVYLMGIAHSYKLPWYIYIQMLWNAFIDWLIGLIPLLGDIFDIGWKANIRNVNLIKTYTEKSL